MSILDMMAGAGGLMKAADELKPMLENFLTAFNAMRSDLSEFRGHIADINRNLEELNQWRIQQSSQQNQTREKAVNPRQ
jgi:uncharacterized coiled-coil DUF342 family protein